MIVLAFDNEKRSQLQDEQLTPFFLCKPEYDSMPAFWIFPFNILIRTANPAAAAFVAAFIANLHSGSFPLINFSGAKNGTKFFWTLGHANIMIKHR